MLRIDIEARLADLSEIDFKTPMDMIARYLQRSIQDNFARGGRPQWKNKKDGSPSHLFKTGRLFDSIDQRSDDKSAEAGVFTGNMPPYAWAHQMGRLERNLVPRPYVMFQDGDIDFIRTEMEGYIVSFLNTNSKPIT